MSERYEDPVVYNDGAGNYAPQMIPFYWQRKAMIDLLREMYFSQLADSTSMPTHYGKTIKKYHYVPLLDDRNVNDQGIDATGASTADEVTISITDPAGFSRYAVGTGADAATALTAAKTNAESLFKNLGIFQTSYDATKTALEAAGWTIEEGDAVNNGGNLYGSSRDVGVITNKMPTISETGGRVNRVGFTRITLEASMHQFGFFEEYTEDSIQFDNDAQLMEHVARESMRAANYIYEDKLGIDLLNNANVVFYGGDATSMATVTGETTATLKSELTYDMLINLDTILNNNRCPKDTKIITGSTNTDTKVVPACRYAYIGSELKMTLLKMKNFHNEKAFIPVEQYAAAGTLAKGEIGSCGPFRFIENMNMPRWEGAGAAVTSNGGYFEHNGKYDVFPMLVVGSGSFTTIGFQSSGSSKFKILNKKPGIAMADRDDPYGKIGFWSIQWWYGFMALRPEWLACVKVVAPR